MTVRQQPLHEPPKARTVSEDCDADPLRDQSRPHPSRGKLVHAGPETDVRLGCIDYFGGRLPVFSGGDGVPGS